MRPHAGDMVEKLLLPRTVSVARCSCRPSSGKELVPMTVEVTTSVDVAQMLDALPERVVRYRMDDLRVTYCNAAWAAAHGSTAIGVIGHTLDEFLSPSEMLCLDAQLARFDPRNLIITDTAARPA